LSIGEKMLRNEIKVAAALLCSRKMTDREQQGGENALLPGSGGEKWGKTPLLCPKEEVKQKIWGGGGGKSTALL